MLNTGFKLSKAALTLWPELVVANLVLINSQEKVNYVFISLCLQRRVHTACWFHCSNSLRLSCCVMAFFSLSCLHCTCLPCKGEAMRVASGFLLWRNVKEGTSSDVPRIKNLQLFVVSSNMKISKRNSIFVLLLIFAAIRAGYGYWSSRLVAEKMRFLAWWIMLSFDIDRYCVIDRAGSGKKSKTSMKMLMNLPLQALCCWFAGNSASTLLRLERSWQSLSRSIMQAKRKSRRRGS